MPVHSSFDRHRSSDCIHDRFEAQAERTPDSLAVVSGDRKLTYGELDQRANQLAHHLRRLGVRPDTLVGICVDRSVDLVVGLLGILKAGGAYLPIDPQYPAERRAFMLQDACAPVFITETGLAPDQAVAGTTTVLLDRDWPAVSREPRSAPDVMGNPDNLAYVIYTSGSTGTPKGALISHRNVVRLFDTTEKWFNFTADDVWTLFHSCAFDFSVWELWGALFHGGRLVVVPFGLSRTPEAFHRLLCDEGVTVLNQTPSAFRQLIRADEGARADALQLRYVIFGGEALDPASLKPWFERHGDTRPRLINMYGITETTVHVTYRPLAAADLDSGSVIGIPIPDLQIHLLDEQQKPVPAGEPGEIYVGGGGVCRGYLNRPELTAQKFIADPFTSQSTRRLYRTGDLGRLLPGGDLEYLGRIDQQVKIRGFRIELGEISAELGRHAAVRDSAVTAREDAPGEKALAAYVVRRDGIDVSAADLRQMLRRRLPEYMVPATFTFIDRLPLTVNGKLDVQALPPPARDTPAATGFAPESPLEQDISTIWKDVLKIREPGSEENFFDVGGNSLHMAEVHARLQELLGRKFPITELFAHTTIRSLAAHFSSTAPSTQTDAHLRARRQRDTLAAHRNIRLRGK